MTTRRAARQEVLQVKIDYRGALSRMEYGDKLFLKDVEQKDAGARASQFNKDGKRFVTKKGNGGTYIIRVA